MPREMNNSNGQAAKNNAHGHGPKNESNGQGPGNDNGLRLGQDLGQGHTRADVHLMQERALAYRLTNEDDFLQAEQFYYTQFTALNGSGVSGGAIIGYDQDTNSITVAISARGLEPNQVHVQHIHGFPSGQDAKTPTAAFDTDGDSYVELAEGIPAYGPVLLNLAANHANGAGGDNGHAHDGAATGFPTAPDGMIRFVETYQLPQGDLGADPMLALREIVLHGLSVPAGAGAGTPGEVDGTGGYKLVLPVASGELVEVGSAQELRAFARTTDFDQGWVVG